MRELSIAENVATIRDRINRACEKANRHPNEVEIIAVTKSTTIEKARELLDHGIIHLGENRDREFLHKYEAIKDQATWHFIGTLQTRKVKNIIDYVNYIHSLDRLKLAEEINKRANKPISCFVQVNVSNEPTKHGLPVEETIPFIEKLKDLPNIQVVGLMTMAPHTDDENLIRSVFRKLKELKEEVQGRSFPHAPCKELSMGMSNDFEIAIEEGATFVRIGTALVKENS